MSNLYLDLKSIKPDNDDDNDDDNQQERRDATQRNDNRNDNRNRNDHGDDSNEHEQQTTAIRKKIQQQSVTQRLDKWQHRDLTVWHQNWLIV